MLLTGNNQTLEDYSACALLQTWLKDNRHWKQTAHSRTVWTRIYSFSLICVHRSFMAWQEVISLAGGLMSLNKNHHKRCIQAKMAFNCSSSMGPSRLIKHAPLLFLKFYSSSSLYGAILSSCLQLCYFSLTHDVMNCWCVRVFQGARVQNSAKNLGVRDRTPSSVPR